MGFFQDRIEGKGSSGLASFGGDAPSFNPRANSLLLSQLRTISQYGSDQQARKAQKVASGGDPPFGAKALGWIGKALGYPRRAIQVAAEEGSDVLQGKWGQHDYWHQLGDDSFGAGTWIKEAFPHAPDLAVSTGGILGDLAVDPLTYVGGGLSPELKAMGGTEGLGKLLQDEALTSARAGDLARHDELLNLAAKSFKGARGIKNPDFMRAAEMLGREPGELRYALRFHIPFAHYLPDIGLEGQGASIGKAANFIKGMGDEGVPLGSLTKQVAADAGPGAKALDAVSRAAGKAGDIYGRGVYGAGETLSEGLRGRWSKVIDPGPASPLDFTEADKGLGRLGKMFGGQLREAKIALRSGDPEIALMARRTISGIQEAAAGEHESLRAMTGQLNKLERAAGKAGLKDGVQLREILDEAPPTAKKVAELLQAGREVPPEHMLGGPKWQKFAANATEEQMAAANGWRQWFNDNPEAAKEFARFADKAMDVIHPAEMRDRLSYTPRIANEKFAEKYLRGTARPGYGEAAGFQKAGLAPDAVAGTAGATRLDKFYKTYGEGLVGGELHQPGEVVSGDLMGQHVENVTMGSQSQQIEDAVRAIHGDNYTPWYEPDLFKASRAYANGVSGQIGNTRLQNYLHATGITDVLGASAPPPWTRTAPVAATEGGSWWSEVSSNLVTTRSKASVLSGKSLWMDNLFYPKAGKALPKNMTAAYQEIMDKLTVARTGKLVDTPTYNELNSLIAEGHPMVDAVTDQFTARAGDEAKWAGRASLLDEQANRMQMLHDSGVSQNPKQIQELRERATNYRGAADAFKLRDAAPDEVTARIHHLEGSHRALLGSAQGISKTIDELTAAQIKEGLGKSFRPGWEGFGFGREAPSKVVGMLEDVSRTFDPISGDGIGGFIRDHWDPLNHWSKEWMTASPGFHMRNLFGGTFNNWLGGVRTSSSFKWGNTYRKSWGDGYEALAEHDKALVDVNRSLGVTGEGLFASGTYSELGTAAKATINPASGIPLVNKAAEATGLPGAIVGGEGRTFALPYASRALGEQIIEPYLRGAMATDRVLKAVENGRFASMGINRMEDIATPALREQFVREVERSGLHEQIISDINKYHFDYQDLSKFERNVVRRVVPFYTWTRKNIPLQVEMMFTQPGKFLNTYQTLKRNMEILSPQQQIVPNYFAEQGFIRTPWTSHSGDQGGQVYATTNLPFFDLFQAANPGELVTGHLSPFIKAPIEAKFGKQFYNGIPLTDEYKPVSNTWTNIPGFMKAIQVASKVPFFPMESPVKGTNGQWLMKDKDMYLMGQYIPLYYQLRRFGDEKKYQNRLTTTFLSYMFGLNVRTNTPQDMESEMFRRYDTLTGMANQLKSQGLVTGTEPKYLRPKKLGGGPSLQAVLAQGRAARTSLDETDNTDLTDQNGDLVNPT